MKEPHVVSLVYRAESAKDITYDDPPPVEIDKDKWEGCLENGILTCRMKTHYASVSAARKEIESYLRAWEVNANLSQGKGSIRFVYQDANVIDLAPQRTGHGVVVCGKAIAMGIGTATVSVQISRKNYPPPPENFAVSPDVETLLYRYQGYLDGKEPLPSMAYFCLKLIEVFYGQETKTKERQAAARSLRMEFRVLSELGRLTTTKGDITTARKPPAQGIWQPLSGTERRWIEAVIRRLIYRVGEYAACGGSSSLNEATLRDFPPLE